MLHFAELEALQSWKLCRAGSFAGSRHTGFSCTHSHPSCCRQPWRWLNAMTADSVLCQLELAVSPARASSRLRQCCVPSDDFHYFTHVPHSTGNTRDPANLTGSCLQENTTCSTAGNLLCCQMQQRPDTTPLAATTCCQPPPRAAASNDCATTPLHYSTV
jgi:hypothetical protein